MSQSFADLPKAPTIPPLMYTLNETLDDILYPEIKPYNEGLLKVSELHKIWYGEYGNPKGLPVIVVHGGPGAGNADKFAQYFDPTYYRIILFDQRGSGKSIPAAEMKENTSQNSISDMELLRGHLKINKWLLFGGSWGSTLSLIYGQAHPGNCLGFILRGIVLCTPPEYKQLWYGMRDTFPEAWDEMVHYLPEDEREDLIKAYYKRLMDPDPNVHMPAARAFVKYDIICSIALQPVPFAMLEDDNLVLNLARTFTHYCVNDFFLKPNQILNDMPKIAHLPAIIVHGRYDTICRASRAYELYKNWPDSELVFVQDGGHASMEPPVAKALVNAAEKFKFNVTHENDHITLETHDPNWPLRAKEEIDLIKDKCSFPWIVGIEHFGSTSIKGIKSKPLLDIIIGVKDIELAKAMVPILESMGYLFWAENPQKDRLMFVKGIPPYGERRTHHVHVFATSNYEWFARRAFRDYLNANADIASNYENLKEQLLEKSSEDREAYSKSKTEYVRTIIQKAVIPFISFVPLQEIHFPLLQAWMNNEHVSKWWGEDKSWTIADIKEKYQSYTKQYKIQDGKQKSIDGFIIEIANQPVGYIQYYNVYDFPRDNYPLFAIEGLPKSLAAIDFYIGGDSFTGHGLGSVIVEQFLQKFVDPNFEFCFVDPDIENYSAICSYEKSGFKQYKTLNDQKVILMLRKKKI